MFTSIDGRAIPGDRPIHLAANDSHLSITAPGASLDVPYANLASITADVVNDEVHILLVGPTSWDIVVGDATQADGFVAAVAERITRFGIATYPSPTTQAPQPTTRAPQPPAHNAPTLGGSPRQAGQHAPSNVFARSQAIANGPRVTSFLVISCLVLAMAWIAIGGLVTLIHTIESPNFALDPTVAERFVRFLSGATYSLLGCFILLTMGLAIRCSLAAKAVRSSTPDPYVGKLLLGDLRLAKRWATRADLVLIVVAVATLGWMILLAMLSAIATSSGPGNFDVGGFWRLVLAGLFFALLSLTLRLAISTSASELSAT